MILNPQKHETNWRKSMWVMTKDGIGILVNVVPTVVDLVDPDSGETKAQKLYQNLLELRQATFAEIPAKRKVGFSAERASELGY